MEIMLITPHQNKDKEIEIVTQLFETGLSTLHLNKPNMSTRQMREYIAAIPEHFHNRIIVHTHHDLAFRFNLKGIHFTRHHLEREFKNWWWFQKEKFFGRNLIHTRSYHKISDVFNTEKYFFDYYLLKNVFNSITNDFNIGYHPLRIAEIQKMQKKLVVRGGVNLITAQKAKMFGFYGICLYSFIWKSENPVQSFVELYQSLQT